MLRYPPAPHLKQAIGGNVTFDPRLTIGWKRRFAAAAAMRAHAAHEKGGSTSPEG